MSNLKKLSLLLSMHQGSVQCETDVNIKVYKTVLAHMNQYVVFDWTCVKGIVWSFQNSHRAQM